MPVVSWIVIGTLLLFVAALIYVARLHHKHDREALRRRAISLRPPL